MRSLWWLIAPTRGVEKINISEVLTTAILGPGGTVMAEAQVTVPGGTEGTWRWQVQANSEGEVFEGRNWTNNVSSLSAATMLRVPELAIGVPQHQSFATAKQPTWFKVAQPAGQDLLVMLDSAATNGRVRLYVGFDSMPTETSFDQRSTEWNSLNPRVGVPAAPVARAVYLLAVPELADSLKLAYTIQTLASSFGISALGLTTGGNAGNVTIPLVGSGFGDGLEVQLRRVVAGSSNSVSPLQILRQDSANALVTFNLRGVAPGFYNVFVTQQGINAVLNQTFQVVPGVGAKFNATLVLPKFVRVGRVFQAVIEYSNEGDADMPVPLVYVQNNGGCPMWMDSQDAESALTSLQFLAMAPESAPANVLRPGERHSLTFRTRLIADADVAYSVSWYPGDSKETVDWNLIKAAVRPIDATPAWDQAWNQLAQKAGPSVGGYLSALVEAAGGFRDSITAYPSPGTLLRLLVLSQLAQLPDASARGAIFDGNTNHPIGQTQVLLAEINGNPNVHGAVRLGWLFFVLERGSGRIQPAC